MRLWLPIAFVILVMSGVVFSQDGSNMFYVKTAELDKSYIGRLVQIDFYRKSHGNRQGGGINVDKVFIEIGGKQIEFLEHREDDGLNNWFREQYLESTDGKVRIKEFKLLRIEPDSIVVKGYFNVDPFEKEFTFKKTDVAQLLIKVTD